MNTVCEHCGKGVTGQYCHACSKAASKKVVSKRKVVGVCLIVAPWLGLVFLMSAYAIVSFVLNSAVDTSSIEMFIDAAYASSFDEGEATLRSVGSILSVVLGLGGFLCLVGIFVCTPIGIYLLMTDGRPKGK